MKAEYEEKFIVIKRKHLNKVPLSILEQFDFTMKRISEYIPRNNYIVCNQDEPYAEDVLKIILDGESKKNITQN